MVKRGKQILAKIEAEISPENAGVSTTKQPAIARKYEAILYRYYYYVKLHKMQYDDVISGLQQDFFLGDERLSMIITKNIDRLKTITAAKPTVKELAEKYPTFSWVMPTKTSMLNKKNSIRNGKNSGLDR